MNTYLFNLVQWNDHVSIRIIIIIQFMFMLHNQQKMMGVQKALPIVNMLLKKSWAVFISIYYCVSKGGESEMASAIYLFMISKINNHMMIFYRTNCFQNWMSTNRKLLKIRMMRYAFKINWWLCVYVPCHKMTKCLL